MAGDIKTEKAVYQTRKDCKAKSSAKPSEVDTVHEKEHDRSCMSPGQVEVSSFNSKESGLAQEFPAEQEKYCPTTNCYEYYYPGYDGAFGEWGNVDYCTNRNGHDISYLGNPLDGSSMVYYVSGYDTYAPGMLMPPGGQYFAQPPFCLTPMYSQPSSSPAIPRGTDGLQTFSGDSVPLSGDGLTTPAGFGNPKINVSGEASEHSKVSNKKTPSIIPTARNFMKSSSDDSSCISSSSANVPAPAILSEPLKPSSKVNASGQFCGLAEMIGMVDFKKSMDFWQQDMWNGFFPVKWHIIKDIPNSQFRHIILKNNENKRVTNSRDTQEIEFLQGLEMLKIFKSYAAEDSILDDFGYYEWREKLLMKSRNTSPALESRTDLQLVGEEGEKTNPLENAKQHSLVTCTKNLSLSGGPDGARVHQGTVESRRKLVDNK